jgi:ferredoxin
MPTNEAFTAVGAAVQVPGVTAGASAPLLPATAMRRVARLDEPDLCIGCGTCVDACPPSAIRIDEIAVIHKDVCTGCGECVEACPRGVLSLVEA